MKNLKFKKWLIIFLFGVFCLNSAMVILANSNTNNDDDIPQDLREVFEDNESKQKVIKLYDLLAYLIEELSHDMNVYPPGLYLAYGTDDLFLSCDTHHIIIGSDIIKTYFIILNKEEIKAIFAHELAHKKHDHNRLAAPKNHSQHRRVERRINDCHILPAKIKNLLKKFNDIFMFRRGRQIEKEADLTAAKFVNPKSLISMLRKIHSNIPENLPLKDTLFNDHPILWARIKYLKKVDPAEGARIKELKEMFPPIQDEQFVSSFDNNLKKEINEVAEIFTSSTNQ